MAAVNQIAIDVRQKCYRGGGSQPRVALQDLRLSGRAGEFVCLFGPSGCGKTTVLNIAAGLDADFDGKVDLPTAEGRTTPVIGYVFQDPRLLPWRTVEENIRLAIDDASAANGRIGSLLSAMGLDSHRRAYPGQLSLGLARRVALARAFVVEPDLLLMDEPFASLDAPTAERLRRLLIEIWSLRPTTVLFVTHDLREAIHLADRIVFLSAGPAHVIADIPIDLPRPRRGDAEVDAIRTHLLTDHGPELTQILTS